MFTITTRNLSVSLFDYTTDKPAIFARAGSCLFEVCQLPRRILHSVLLCIQPLDEMADYSSRKLKRVIGGEAQDENGDFLISQAHHMAYNDGKLYASEMLSHRVRVFEAADGKFVQNIGELGSFDGEFNVPAGIASLGDKLVVCDLNNCRLETFKFNGEFLSEIGSEGDGPNNFGNPNSICVDPKSKDVFVAEATNQRVQIFDKDFNHKSFIKSRGSEFKSCNHVSFDSVNNRVIITDAEGSDVSLFDPATGAVVCSLQGDADEFIGAAKAVADSAGNILVCEMGQNQVMVFDKDGKKIGKFAAEHEFSYPEDIAFGPNGEIFILEGNLFSGWSKISIF